MRISKILYFFILASVILITSCDDEVASGDPNFISFDENSFSEDAFITFLTDSPNSKTFSFAAGTYNFTNTIPLADINSLTITGAGRDQTFFDFSGSTSTSGEGIAAIDCWNLVLCGFTVQNTNGGNGITARNIQGLRFSDVGVVWPASSQDNGTYGIYPVESDDVIVENCYAQAAIDAGIYSGQNKRVILRNNKMTLNVFGMEVENNVDAEVYGNEFIENTGGLLVYDLAGVDRIKSGANCKVYDNTFTNNNQTNFAELGSTFAADVPPGLGILYASTSSLEITGNTFVDNETTSILGVSYFLVDGGFSPLDDILFTYYNYDIYIHDNSYSSGGGVYNQAGVLDRPGGPLIEGVIALNGGVRAQILLDDQNYTPAGVPIAGSRPVIDEPSSPTIAEASFVGATQGIIAITSTDLADFAGTGNIPPSFSLVYMPSECN